MAKIVTGTKDSPAQTDTLIIKDSEDDNTLKEMTYSDLISHVENVDIITTFNESILGAGLTNVFGLPQAFPATVVIDDNGEVVNI